MVTVTGDIQQNFRKENILYSFRHNSQQQCHPRMGMEMGTGTGTSYSAKEDSSLVDSNCGKYVTSIDYYHPRRKQKSPHARDDDDEEERSIIDYYSDNNNNSNTIATTRTATNAILIFVP